MNGSPSTAARPVATAAPVPPRNMVPAALVSVAVGLFLFGYSVVETRARAAASRTWAEGQLATGATIDGTVKASRMLGVTLPIYTYDLKLRFLDSASATHEVTERLSSSFEELDTTLEPAVRYDPADPSRAVSSWAASLTSGPRVAAGWGFIGGLLMAFYGIKLLLAARRGA